MNADSAFHIGASHQVCEDYALAWNGSRLQHSTEYGSTIAPYLILSDGCSSSTDTDIGARLLAKAAEQILIEAVNATAVNPEEMHKEAARRALSCGELLGLSQEALDAPLLTAHIEGDELVIGSTGDGVICLQSDSGVMDVYSISYTSGYPIYPSYTFQPARLLALEEGARASKEVKHFHSPSLEEPLRLLDTASGGPETETLTVRTVDYRYLVLFSDGVGSFYSTEQTETSKRASAVPMNEVIRGLVSFRSPRGAFVERRLRGFMKYCLGKGWRHMDDLSVCALYLGD